MRLLAAALAFCIVAPAAAQNFPSRPIKLICPFPPAGAVDVLVELGALDIEAVGAGLAAILPDSVKPEAVAGAAQSHTGRYLAPLLQPSRPTAARRSRSAPQ